MPREIRKKVRNAAVYASLDNAFQGTQSMCQQRDDVGRHRVAYTVGCREVPTPRLEPIGRQPLWRRLMPRKLSDLVCDVHDAALGHVPSRETRFLRAKAEVGLLEIEEVVLV